jgi:general secretion pathway protein B
MSYILDALRRAQAERERGQVPGLEARTLVQTPPPPPQRRATAMWVGGALAVGVLGVAGMLVLRGGAAPVTAPVGAQAPVPTPVPPLAAPSPLPAPPAPMVVVSAPAAPPPGAAPVNPPAPSGLAGQPAPGSPTPTPTPLQTPLPTPTSTPTAPPAANAVRPVQLAQLSAELRRELPAMVLGGAIWSDNAASRFVIVNGQVLREGEAAAPGVLLERIGPKAVFLRWRDWRIEVPI